MVKNRMNASSDEDFSYESSTSGEESKVETFEAEGGEIHSVGYSHIPNRRTYRFIYFLKICIPIRHYSGLYVY